MKIIMPDLTQIAFWIRHNFEEPYERHIASLESVPTSLREAAKIAHCERVRLFGKGAA